MNEVNKKMNVNINISNNIINDSHIWRPFTQEKTALSAIKIIKGEGLYLIDENGKKYADMISSWWVNILGHSNREIAEAISEQASKLEHVIFTAFTHNPAEELVKKLQSVLPQSLNKFFFSDNGSTAVEVALKIAYQYFKNSGNSKRKLYLHLEGSYHGDTFGAMSVSGKNSMYHFNFSDFFFDTISIKVPEFYDGINEETIEKEENEIIETLEKQLERKENGEKIGNQICALIVEPLLQGARGMILYRPEFLKKLIQTVRKFGILIIFDEVMTGFYRTGQFFAMNYLFNKEKKDKVEKGDHDNYENLPDLLCVSKGLTGGFLPLSITIATQKIYDAFLSDNFSKAFIHGHSYTGNPISCAAACKAFEILTREATLKNITMIEKLNREKISEINQEFGASEAFEKSKANKKVEKTRTLGTMSAFDLLSEKSAQGLTAKLFKKGIFIRPLGKTIYLLPPYCISERELENTYTEIKKVINDSE